MRGWVVKRWKGGSGGFGRLTQLGYPLSVLEQRMHIGVYLILLGLLVELVAGLILAMEAIGLERAERWVSSLKIWSFQTTINRIEDPNADPGRQRVLIAISCGIGAGAGGLLCLWLEHHFGWPRYVAWTGVFGGAAVSIFVPTGIRAVLGAVLRLLRFAKEKTELKVAGVFGFAVLSFGIALQAIGTIVDALSRH